MHQRRQRAGQRQRRKRQLSTDRRQQTDRQQHCQRLRKLTDALREHLANQGDQRPKSLTFEGLADAAADETDALLLERLSAELAHLEAVAWHAEHGTCVHCGRRIPQARRAALPGVATCVRCTGNPDASAPT